MNMIVDGFSRGFSHFKTTKSAASWERRYALKGAVAALMAGAAVATIYAVGPLAVVTSLGGLLVGYAVASRFYRFLDRDIER